MIVAILSVNANPQCQRCTVACHSNRATSDIYMRTIEASVAQLIDRNKKMTV